MSTLETKYLERLSELYPTISSAATEIINLQSILNLPKGTEHFLTDIHGEHEAFFHVLKNGSGHIGFGIGKEYRNQGYATRGLQLAVQELKKMMLEDEIYMSVNKNNLASIKVQENNGAYIHHEDDENYYTRIKR